MTTLPQPGQWVRVNHACPGVEDKHCEPVEVVSVLKWNPWSPGYRITTRRCDGLPMNLYAYRNGEPVPGDEWEVVE